MKERLYLLWVPVWILLSILACLFKPGVISPSVHWTESFLWALGYTAVAFFPAYWIVRAINKELHPAWRVFAGALLVAAMFYAGYGK
jgi:hypothetical protein